jgi:oligosaccharide repeat unit polymerase
LNVLNLINSVSGNFGITHGKLILSAIPGSSGLSTRMIIGKLIAWRGTVSITPTIIGPMLLDFGRLGVVFGMCLIGFILGLGYKIMRISKDFSYIFIYSLLLTYAIICIETGLMEINVLGYFSLGFLFYMANVFYNKKIKVGECSDG